MTTTLLLWMLLLLYSQSEANRLTVSFLLINIHLTCPITHDIYIYIYSGGNFPLVTAQCGKGNLLSETLLVKIPVGGNCMQLMPPGLCWLISQRLDVMNTRSSVSLNAYLDTLFVCTSVLPHDQLRSHEMWWCMLWSPPISWHLLYTRRGCWESLVGMGVLGKHSFSFGYKANITQGIGLIPVV